MRTLGGLVLFFFTAHGIGAQEAVLPAPSIPKLDASYFEKAWGMMPREGSYAVTIHQNLSPDRRTLRVWARLSYVVEFRRDITQFDLDELQRVLIFVGDKRNIRHFFFDKDDIAFHVRYPYFLDGDISGAKGDALRITIESIPLTIMAPPGKEIEPAEAEAARARVREFIGHTKKVVVRPGLGHQ